jgi:hypothetical protein
VRTLWFCLALFFGLAALGNAAVTYAGPGSLRIQGLISLAFGTLDLICGLAWIAKAKRR